MNMVPPTLQGASLILFFLLSMSSLLLPSADAFAAEATGAQLLEQIQNVFIDLAERVRPAVVNIAPISTSARSQETLRDRSPNNPGSGSGQWGGLEWLQLRWRSPHCPSCLRSRRCASR